MKRRLLITGVALLAIALVGVCSCKPTPPLEEEGQEVAAMAHLWENGTEQFVAAENSPMSDFLFQTLRRLNLQAFCLVKVTKA